MVTFNMGLAILELSSGAVKLLLGPSSRNKKFNPDNFRFYKTVTKTKSGLKGGKMDLVWFKNNILPVIKKYLGYCKGYKIKCVATAWARECKNIKEIQDILPVPMRVLSGVEEAKFPLIGYINSTNRNLRKFDNIISLDIGNLSTELSIYGGYSVSVPNSSQKKIESIISSLPGKTLIAFSKYLYNGITGKPDKMNLHDTEFPIKNNEDFLKRIKSCISDDSLIVYNGTNLIFGVYYDK